MTSKKKDLEIVYNLEWKNKPANGDEKSNMVGILDIPATTLDWKTFKSYLLKNSGAADDNVKVSYIDSEDREKAITSQLDFEIALYTFRHKARMNEIITLKLDCINSKKSTSSVKSIAKGLSEVQVKMKPKLKKTEEPPEWFLTYMKKFKEEMVEEMSAVCSSKAHQMNIHHARKLKADSYKRTRKAPLLMADTINDKELSKSAKMERKLESKLEKLEHKTMKIKAKKMALRGSSDSDVGRSSSKNETITYLPPNTNNDMSMNASVLRKSCTPHMMGGEPYRQTWEVCNSGTLPWTSDTELRYAWGSQALKPIQKEVLCPNLNPGEKGEISVLLDIPKMPGTYECYWHFYHKGRRFGHWLGCEVVVDGPPVKNTPYLPSPTYDVINIQDVYELVLPTSWTSPKKTEDTTENDAVEEGAVCFGLPEVDPQNFVNCFAMNMSQNNQNLTEKKEEEAKDGIDGKPDLFQVDMKAETNAFSDSDNQSIVSISDSNSSVNSATSEDFVVLKMCNLSKCNVDVSHDDLPIAPNLTKMNVSSLENIDNIDHSFTNLTLDDEVGMHLKTDDDAISSPLDSRTEDTPPTSRCVAPSSTVQQIPIDLSNKSIPGAGDGGIGDNMGFAYVHYKGQKIPISKKHLSADFLTTAESVPECEMKKFENFKIEQALEEQEKPVKNNDEPILRTSTPCVDTNDGGQSVQGNPTDSVNATTSVQETLFSSIPDNPRNGCSVLYGQDYANEQDYSMSSSTNENRFFVFPQYYPGYEVVPPSHYYDPNTMSYQTFYRNSNILGEVLVNDWSTGLNYTSCYKHPSSPNQPCNSTGDSTPNISRASNSVPNSNGPTPQRQSPPSAKEPCCYNRESHFVNSCNSHCSFEPNFNPTNTSFEDMHTSTQTNSTGTGGYQNPNSNASNRPKSPGGVLDFLPGATVVANSAMNTARSVLNMIVPRNNDCGRWQNGHWVSTNPRSRREQHIRLLHDMGFPDRDLNATLLARYNDDIYAVIGELLH